MAREITEMPTGIAGYEHLSVKATRRVTRKTGSKMRRQTIECVFGKTRTGRYYARAKGHGVVVRVAGPKRDVVNMMFEAALNRVGWRLPHAKGKS